jgi:hypothetical protein
LSQKPDEMNTVDEKATHITEALFAETIRLGVCACKCLDKRDAHRHRHRWKLCRSSETNWTQQAFVFLTSASCACAAPGCHQGRLRLPPTQAGVELTTGRYSCPLDKTPRRCWILVGCRRDDHVDRRSLLKCIEPCAERDRCRLTRRTADRSPVHEDLAQVQLPRLLMPNSLRRRRRKPFLTVHPKVLSNCELF